MRGRMLYDPVRLASGARIHLFKVDRGALEGDWEADRIATKLRERLFAAHRPPAVVIMEGTLMLPEHLPLPERLLQIPATTTSPAPAAASDLEPKPLADVEREHILKMLQAANESLNKRGALVHL